MTLKTKQRLNKAALFRDLGYEPHPGQREVHESNAPRRILACGVRWGKSLCAAMEGVAAAMEPAERSMGWVVAPTYDLADKVFREILLIVTRHLRHRIVTLRENQKQLVLRNMAGGLSEVRARSADNPVSLIGEGLDWLIVDEAARLKPAIWEGHLSQRLIDKKGWALLISTPRGKGWFYEMYRRGQREDDTDHASWNSASVQNPHLDAALIEQERSRLPARVFDQEYGAKFVEGSGSVFRNVRECATATWQPPAGDGLYRAGLDLAMVEDFSVLAIMDEFGDVVFVDRFHRVDWTLQVRRIKTACDRYNDARVLVDSTGVGDPILERLWDAGCAAHPYPFTQRSKSALVNNLSLLLEKREIRLPKPELWPEGIDELEAFEYRISQQGTVRMGAPSGQHDDCVIALALASWAHVHRPGEVQFSTIDI